MRELSSSPSRGGLLAITAASRAFDLIGMLAAGPCSDPQLAAVLQEKALRLSPLHPASADYAHRVPGNLPQ
jgi:hypothetical protein